MKTNYRYALLCGSLMLCIMLSCGDDGATPVCDTFTPADSVCFCKGHPEELACRSFNVSIFTEEKPVLGEAPNGTMWTKGFAIGRAIYIIDRESGSPHAFWKFDLDAGQPWQRMADFPGDGYGLTGSANGKGYASSYASTAFWEYDPANDAWTPLSDLPFSATEMHWVEHKGKFYFPGRDGIYEFNATTKEWIKISDQASIYAGGIFRVEEDMYWYNINHNYMSRFNLESKSFEQHSLPEDFGWSTSFNSPFTIDDTVYIIISDDLWIFDNSTHTWSFREGLLKSGSCYADDSFVVDQTVYLIDNGVLKEFEVGSGD